MKDLFDPILVEDTKQRILRLRLESERQWGSMAVAQTLAHCTSGIEMAMGVIRAKHAPFPANLIGRLIKPLVFRDDRPMRRNSPSSPELFSAGSTKCEFISERARLIAAIESFASQGLWAAPPTRTRSSVHSTHNSGPSSRTNTLTIISGSSAFNGIAPGVW
jgi:hypothetical protein